MEIWRMLREWWHGKPQTSPAHVEADPELVEMRKKNELMLRKLSLASAKTEAVTADAIKAIRKWQ
jgi:hypothetical protein